MNSPVQQFPLGEALIRVFNVGDTRMNLPEMLNATEADWAPRYRAHFAAPTKAPILCIHVTLPTMTVLVDSGLYDFPESSPFALPNYTPPPGLPAQLAAAGLDPAGVDHLIITHAHGDHFNAETLAALVGDNTKLVTNPAVHDKLPDALKAKATAIGNGESHTEGSVGIDAIPAYNMTEGRTQFHPQGRDNGYVVTVDGKRVYISGDTEDIPEMRALTDIDIAFVCMNLPFTMDANQAASAVTEFAPSVVYPYHYRGRDDGTQDPAEFARLLSEAGGKAEVVVGPWYG